MHHALYPMRWGVVFGILTIAYGFSLGMLFGGAEDSLKAGLKADAQAVLADVYKGDTAKADKITSKSWSYLKRSHMHAGGIGAAALALIAMLSMLAVKNRFKTILSWMLGLGALGYSFFWLLAGFAAPGLGSTDAAKESLTWLAAPSALAIYFGTLATLALAVAAATGKIPTFARAQADD